MAMAGPRRQPVIQEHKSPTAALPTKAANPIATAIITLPEELLFTVLYPPSRRPIRASGVSLPNGRGPENHGWLTAQYLLFRPMASPLPRERSEVWHGPFESSLMVRLPWEPSGASPRPKVCPRSWVIEDSTS